MTADQGDPQASEPIGSVAQEAARLIGMFAGHLSAEQIAAAAARAAGSAGGSGSAEQACQSCGHDPGASQTSAVCRACPVCRVLAVVRAISPEAMDRVADVVDLLSDGLRAYAISRRASLQREEAARARAGARSPNVRQVDPFDPDGDEFASDSELFDSPGNAFGSDSDAAGPSDVDPFGAETVDPFDPDDDISPHRSRPGPAAGPAREARG